MPQNRKDEAAERAVKAAIRKMFGRKNVDRIVVLPTVDQAGELGLSVTVYLRAAQERMSGSTLLDAIAEASTALRAIEDHRFPYMTFLAPEDDGAEKRRPAA